MATALTVGATDTTDARTTWSNYGTCVDVYAPGNNIVSSYGKTQDPTAPWSSLSGTSMASPAVAGVAALLLRSPLAPPRARSARRSARWPALNKVNGTNVVGAKLLYSPWTNEDISGPTRADVPDCRRRFGSASASAAPELRAVLPLRLIPARRRGLGASTAARPGTEPRA